MVRGYTYASPVQLASLGGRCQSSGAKPTPLEIRSAAMVRRYTNGPWQFLFCGIVRVGTQQLSPESLRNVLKGLNAGSHPFGKPGPETNENLPYASPAQLAKPW
jgi:hypothetical protein